MGVKELESTVHNNGPGGNLEEMEYRKSNLAGVMYENK